VAPLADASPNLFNAKITLPGLLHRAKLHPSENFRAAVHSRREASDAPAHTAKYGFFNRLRATTVACAVPIAHVGAAMCNRVAR
jgi:hypothetical protein